MEKTEIFETLESIGLKKGEIIVYLDLVMAGCSNVMDISKRTRIHRSNTYDLLEKLKEKGIVDEAIINDKKIYYPIEPEDLLDYHKQKEKELEKIIPLINKIKNTPIVERKVSLSEGLNSFKNIINHLLDLKEKMYIYNIPKEGTELLRGFFDEFHRRRIKRKIPLKIIYESKSISLAKKTNKLDYTQARYLPIKNSKVSIIICGDKVINIIWETPLTTILITNEQIAKTYKEIFESMWEESAVHME